MQAKQLQNLPLLPKSTVQGKPVTRPPHHPTPHLYILKLEHIGKKVISMDSKKIMETVILILHVLLSAATIINEAQLPYDKIE